ncbi:MAG TPA: BON domain-containing protein [Candidatus Polarisedimenticolaceae bacterium]|nr:BON domain-containing protein [Candidatus Polarisedimenticolaceae bacterium]
MKVQSNESPQDAALSNSVRDRLLSPKTVNLSAVKMVSSSGTVYRTGIVTSLDDDSGVVKIAWNVPGVQSTVNALEVQN